MNELSNSSIYMIAGPNGAGKTTFARSFLPSFVQCREFLNADLIAAGLSPFAPETQAFQASKLMLARIDDLVGQRSNFSFETTLSARSLRQSIQYWQSLHYRVVLFFLWLPSAELAVSRVAKRVREGGHHVPEDVIRRRYSRGIDNLFDLYLPILDETYVYDGSCIPPELIGFAHEGEEQILNKMTWAAMLKG